MWPKPVGRPGGQGRRCSSRPMVGLVTLGLAHSGPISKAPLARASAPTIPRGDPAVRSAAGLSLLLWQGPPWVTLPLPPPPPWVTLSGPPCSAAAAAVGDPALPAVFRDGRRRRRRGRPCPARRPQPEPPPSGVTLSAPPCRAGAAAAAVVRCDPVHALPDGLQHLASWLPTGSATQLKWPTPPRGMIIRPGHWVRKRRYMCDPVQGCKVSSVPGHVHDPARDCCHEPPRRRRPWWGPVPAHRRPAETTLPAPIHPATGRS